MNFLQPSYLHLLWLALIPLALWLFRRKARRVQVSTLLFFRTLAREHHESAWLRRLKRLLALLMTLFIILAAVFALARPYREGGGDVPKSLVILLDRSASMAATNDQGVSRLTEAKALLRAKLQGIPDNVTTSLVVYDGKTEVAQSRSKNRRELLRLLEQTPVMPMQDRPEEALAVAKRLAALDVPSQIWQVSDRVSGDEREGLKFFNVALAKSINAGITAFQIRPAPLARNRYEVFVEVTASPANEKPVESNLEARLDGRPVQLRQVELKPGESTRLILPLEGGKGQRLEMELRTPGDVLGWDNVAMAPIPETKPLVVAWFAESPDPFTELALTSMLAEDRIQVLKGGPKDWPLKDKPDVYVFENWLPDQWPADRPILALNPPRSSGPLLAKKLDSAVPYDVVRAVQPEHPVLFRVTSSRVAITQTTVLNVSDTLETLWMAGQEPVLCAGEAGGQRLVVTAFVPGKSEQLALLSAFPLLIGNALYWCAENNDALASVRPHHSGQVVAAEPGLVRWRAWDGSKFLEATEEAAGGWMELGRLGIYETTKGKAQASLLLSERETSLSVSPAKDATLDSKATRFSGGGNWWSMLLWITLGVLLLESWLFHRHAVY
jgi:hypothetical protein